MSDFIFDDGLYFLQVKKFCFWVRANKDRSISVYAPTSRSGVIIFNEENFKLFVKSLGGVINDVF